MLEPDHLKPWKEAVRSWNQFQSSQVASAVLQGLAWRAHIFWSLLKASQQHFESIGVSVRYACWRQTITSCNNPALRKWKRGWLILDQWGKERIESWTAVSLVQSVAESLCSPKSQKTPRNWASFLLVPTVTMGLEMITNPDPLNEEIL